ncbi:tail fiber domain-containing protein [Rossellomorea marisflavi]|uniref:tail fiber domain-containing protein n=1 Tax=Rossellomorea marisflavi TaxID=189381 RepID=UPI003F9F82F6
MEFTNIYNDPIISKKRKGSPDDPYFSIDEILQVVNSKLVLTEIPNREDKVKVKNGSTPLYEVTDIQLKPNTFKVDYAHGVVFFDSSLNGKQLSVSYTGEGIQLMPADRIYYSSEDYDITTVTDKFNLVDKAILEQKNRVDEQMRSVPQPSETMDIRVDKDGKVYRVAKDRIDAEQTKIDEAKKDANNKTHESLKKRIDSEQLKVEEAYRDKNSNLFPSLKARIDSEQGKIDETFKAADGETYTSLKDRLDKGDSKTASVTRRLAKTNAELINGDFKNGEYVRVTSYASIGDGGDGEYLIHNQSGKPIDIQLKNNLKATPVLSQYLSPVQFGAKGDATSDDSSVFSKIESSYTDVLVDLKYKTYVVDSYPSKNKYANGFFKRKSDGRIVGSDYSTETRSGNSTSIYIGKDSGKNSLLNSYETATVGSYNNIGIGYESLMNNIKGYRNVAIGYSAMLSNVDGYYNVAIGDYALADTVGTHSNNDADAGSRNTAVGTNAGRYNTTGIKNVYMGRNAGHASTTGNHNTALGYNAYSGQVTEGVKKDVKTASNNTMVGYNAGFSTNADINTAVGSFALYNNESGKANIAIGHQANSNNKKANNNVAIGVDTLRNHADDAGHDNTAVGTQAMLNLKNGHSNTAVGRKALATTVAGNPAINYSGSIGLGANTKISGSYQCQLGNSGVTVYAYGAIQNRSDMRDKADVRDTVLGIDFIKKLRPVDFKWDYRDDYIIVNEDGTVTKLPKDGSKKGRRYHHGLIAQEVKSVIDSTGVDFGGFQDHQINGGEDLYTIGYEELVTPLVKAVQELSKEIEDMKVEIAALKNK